MAITIAETKTVDAVIEEELIFPEEIRQVDEGLSYIPIWRLAEEAGFRVEIDSEARTLMVKKADRWLEFIDESNEVKTAEGGMLTGRLLYKNENIYIQADLAGGYFGYNISFAAKMQAGREEIFNEFPKPMRRTERNENDGYRAKAGDLEGQELAGENRAALPGADSGRAAKGKKTVYLTFDDGPTGNTPEILDILKSKQAKATFFMLEPQIRQYSGQVKRLVNEGHYPALHSVTHDKNKLYGGSTNILTAEMEQTRKTLFEITGVDSRLTRVPYGSKPFMKEAFRDGLAEGGFKMWDWNIDTKDWKYQRTDPQLILNEVVSGVEALKGKDEPLVILMHVNKGTASVLPQIIDFLQKQGYSCEAYDPDSHFTMNFWKDSRL